MKSNAKMQTFLYKIFVNNDVFNLLKDFAWLWFLNLARFQTLQHYIQLYKKLCTDIWTALLQNLD